MNNIVDNKIVRGTMVIILIGIVAKITSFIAEAILAAYLGTTFRSDAYYMVSSVQAVVYPMLSAGVWKVFMPLYKEKVAQEKEKEADTFTDQSITFFSIISLFSVILLIIFAEVVVQVVAPGFTEATKEICVKLVRISAPMYFFILIAAVYASILQAKNKFLGSQIREVASHVPTILTAIFFYNKYGVEAMAVALVIGGAVRLLIELPFVDWGYKFYPNFHFSTYEFRAMLRRLPSALISEGVTQINTLVDKAMASMLPEGTVSALNYGSRLTNVFSGLLSSAIATALYPQMIELIALKKEKKLSDLMIRTMNIFCLIMVPVSMACMMFSKELVSAVFQRGSFTNESTIITSGVFSFYCLGIYFIACNTVINNLFYGFGDTKTPMYICIVNLLINVALNIILIQVWGVNGLALATSLSAVFTFFIRIMFTKRYIKLNMRKMITTAAKVIFASLIACTIPRIIFWLYPLNKYIVLVVSAILGLICYFILVKIMKVSEVNDFVLQIKKKITKN